MGSSEIKDDDDGGGNDLDREMIEAAVARSAIRRRLKGPLRC